MSPLDRAALVDAMAADLRTVADQAVIAEQRIVKLETQTRVLTDAVVAMADAAATVAPEVKALKDPE